ncbi:hypothetical protein [Bacillus sp. MRMR6]|uniref:hypothetical protein n=1 Tax=Bacillus sp. MRMR6 TaxID=1928617 RepID=UPI0009525447|nr:hypothetical protein [Bacillus sp. MRMR6]OLS40693.1 hypothetical protein BTR25_07285 [Bacillus sp. MRMR6]
MSKEVLAKNTAGVISAVIKQPHWEKEKLQKGLSKVLKQIREGAGSHEEYLESILRNVTYQYANTNTARSFLTQCIEEEKFIPLESFQAIMVDVPRQVKESNFLAENMPRFKELVYQGATPEEQVVHAEKVFYHSKLVNELIVEFIGTFLQPNNQNFMVNFMEYSSTIVVDTVTHYCQSYSNLILEEQ